MCRQVLVVDDDDFARLFARTVLERAGFDVYEVGDVASALSAVTAIRPFAVVTDWNLPDGNGGALARRLHEQNEWLPVILITGDDSVSEPLASEQFASILQKPFTPSALEDAIRSVVVTMT